MIRERGNPVFHFLDRYVGIPAVAVVGASRRRRRLPARIETIGLLKTGGIGDTVLVGGVAADLRRAFPRAKLIFFAGRTNLEMARMVDGVDSVIEVPVKDPLAGIKAMRSVPLDVLLDFGQWPRLEALFSVFSRARFTIGFRTPGQHRHHAYDHIVEHSSEVHELENFRRLARPLGVPTFHNPLLRMPEESGEVSGNYAVFHLWPGGIRSRLKEWPAANWLRLIEDFSQRGMEVLLTGSPSDRNRNEEMISRLGSPIDERVQNAAGVSLKETCGLLAGARLVVSVNTGVMHMAAALGTPLVALHGPTSSKRWGPISPEATVIDSPLSECGYLNLGWEYPSRPPKCMEAIPYEVVRDACQEALARKVALRAVTSTENLETQDK